MSTSMEAHIKTREILAAVMAAGLQVPEGWRIVLTPSKSLNQSLWKLANDNFPRCLIELSVWYVHDGRTSHTKGIAVHPSTPELPACNLRWRKDAPRLLRTTGINVAWYQEEPLEKVSERLAKCVAKMASRIEKYMAVYLEKAKEHDKKEKTKADVIESLGPTPVEVRLVDVRSSTLHLTLVVDHQTAKDVYTFLRNRNET